MKSLMLALLCAMSLAGAAFVAPAVFGDIGCTIIIERTAGSPDVFYHGCPTNNCDPGATCGPDSAVEECECSNGDDTAGCKGKIVYNPDGETVNSVSCTRRDCNNVCEKVDWPNPPVGNSYVCYCPD